jgi:Uma2 family endonuclease
MAQMGAMPLQHDYEYPESDGQPMAETSYHWDVMVDTAEALRSWYEEAPDVWVGSNLFLYYKERTPGIAPDVLVVRGVAKGPRRTFKMWEEGHAPFFILEATSESTRDNDEGKKKVIYQAIGVEEYFLFDPLGEYLKPRLQGFRLGERGFQPIPRHADGSLPSRTTGLILRPEGLRLRLLDAATGTPLLWREEIEAEHRAEMAARKAAEEQAREARNQARVAEERAEQEAAVRRALEEEIARLRAERNS